LRLLIEGITWFDLEFIVKLCGVPQFKKNFPWLDQKKFIPTNPQGRIQRGDFSTTNQTSFFIIIIKQTLYSV